VRACVRAVALQVIHPNFRLFAAMNPPTDVGKKELPTALRNRFTEVLVLPPHDCCCIGRPGPFRTDDAFALPLVRLTGNTC
jgi:hypothetical protein